MNVILPQTLVSTEVFDGNYLFFLAGPVQGGEDWQLRAYRLILNRIQNFHAIIPCRYKEPHPLVYRREGGIESHFVRQTTWERHYLNMASERGCILFWLPCESKSEPRKDGQPYARDTYGELGEWRGRKMYNPGIRLVVGAEKDFPGLSQITQNFREALGPMFRIHSTLEETVEAAIMLAK